MSAEVYPPRRNDASFLSSTVGGSKPLHRFIRGQPKSTGIVVLILGCSLFIGSIAVTTVNIHAWTANPFGLVLGSLFIICGILYIVTARNTTKKTVTISLAITIVTLLATFWTILQLLSGIAASDIFHRQYEYLEDNATESEVWSSQQFSGTHLLEMTVALEVVFVLYSCLGAILFIVMSCFGGAALRSTRSQAVIVMTAATAEAPVE